MKLFYHFCEITVIIWVSGITFVVVQVHSFFFLRVEKFHEKEITNKKKSNIGSILTHIYIRLKNIFGNLACFEINK